MEPHPIPSSVKAAGLSHSSRLPPWPDVLVKELTDGNGRWLEPLSQVVFELLYPWEGSWSAAGWGEDSCSLHTT